MRLGSIYKKFWTRPASIVRLVAVPVGDAEAAGVAAVPAARRGILVGRRRRRGTTDGARQVPRYRQVLLHAGRQRRDGAPRDEEAGQVEQVREALVPVPESEEKVHLVKATHQMGKNNSNLDDYNKLIWRIYISCMVIKQTAEKRREVHIASHWRSRIYRPRF